MIVVLLGGVAVSAQTTPASVPFGELPTLTNTNEIQKDNVFGVGVRVSSNFDDNALNDNRNKLSNLLIVVEPHFDWTASRTQAEWTLSYSPGYSISHQLPAYNSQSHRLDAALQWRFTKRLRVQFHNSFLESTNPFDRLRAAEPVPGSTGVDQPNNSFSATARTRSEQAVLDFIYATSPHGMIGARSSFFDVNYKELQGTQVLGRANSITEQVFYSHHLTRQQWVGVEYSLQNLNAHNPRSSALVHSFLYTHSILLSPHMVFSFFAGPERTAIREELTSSDRSAIQPHQHWAGGATYSWRWNHNGVTAGFSRRISDGAALAGIVRLSSAYAELRHEIAPRWSADALFSYDHNKTLSATQSILTYVSGAGGLTHTLVRGVSLEVRYWRVHESDSGARSGIYLADHNRISMSLQYDFRSRLGR